MDGTRAFGRLLNAFGLGKVKRSDDTGDVLSLQVLMHTIETRDGTPVMMHYGFGSRPHPEADALTIFLGGERSNGITIATGDRRYRIKNIQEGEVWIADDLGQQVYLTRSGIVINGGGLPMVITNVPTTTMSGNLHVAGAVVAGFGGADQVSLQTHLHGGVMPGGGDTSSPIAGT